MNIKFIDTDKMYELGNDILDYLKTYKEDIDFLYTRINDIQSKTFEWVGNDLDKFIEKFNSDYKKLLDVYDSLNDFATCLIDSSELIQNTVNGMSIGD